jgi:hypothetical protein
VAWTRPAIFADCDGRRRHSPVRRSPRPSLDRPRMERLSMVSPEPLRCPHHDPQHRPLRSQCRKDPCHGLRFLQPRARCRLVPGFSYQARTHACCRRRATIDRAAGINRRHVPFARLQARCAPGRTRRLRACIAAGAIELSHPFLYGLVTSRGSAVPGGLVSGKNARSVDISSVCSTCNTRRPSRRIHAHVPADDDLNAVRPSRLASPGGGTNAMGSRARAHASGAPRRDDD